MPILTYHRIVEREPLHDPDRVCTSVARLEAHLDWLATHSYAGVPIDLALRPAQPGEGRRFAITFDDGYRETLRLALPVLQARSLPATVFVVTGTGGSAVWNREPEPLLSRSELLDLESAGIFIGSHGRGHRRLSTLGPEEIRQEVAGSRQDLEQLLRAPVRFFSYPHHDFDGRVLTAVAEARYAGAVGGRSGEHNRYNLHRIDTWRMTTRHLALHVSGVHRWARRQPLPGAIRSLAARLA